MEERWNRYLDALESRLLKVEDFAVEQVPDVAREWLAWIFWSQLGGVVAFLVAACFAYYGYLLCVKTYEKWKKSGDGDTDFPVMGSWFCRLAVVGFIFGAGYFTFMTIKVSVAPKVVLIEKLSELVRGNK